MVLTNRNTTNTKVFVIDNHPNNYRHFKWNDKKGIVIAVFAVVLFSTLLTAWFRDQSQTTIPEGEDWTLQSTKTWLNVYKLCSYQRFHAPQNVSTLHERILLKLEANATWSNGMDIDSSTLAKGILSRTGSLKNHVLHKQLAEWSVPYFGSQYASKNLNPFTIIIRSASDDTGSTSHHLHLKLSDMDSDGSLIEIWDYWIFNW